MDTSLKNIGICCREFGVLPASIVGRLAWVQLGSATGQIRKGKYSYAEALIDALGEHGFNPFDYVLVVGDGAGDGRFFQNLSDVVNHRLSKACHVEGHFLDHRELRGLDRNGDSFRLYGSWKELAKGIDRRLSMSRRTLIFIDVDRTILFPRGADDDQYFLVRNESILEFVESYALSPLDEAERTRVLHHAKTASEHFSDYLKSETNSITYKNEETVAAISLMASIGLIQENWIRGFPRPRNLRELISHGLRKLDYGGWTSGVHYAGAHSGRLSGQEVWDRPRCVTELSQIRSAIESLRPVILPAFRKAEARRMEDLFANGAISWNNELLEVLARSRDASVVLMTDRPAITLGISKSDSIESIDGFFLNHLKRLLG